MVSTGPKTIGKTTVRPTFLREEYSEKFDRTKHCNGCEKTDDWSRDIPLMTV